MGCADKELDFAQTTVDRIASEGGRAVVIAAGVALPTEVTSMVTTAHELMGGLDGLVYNVGISNAGALAEDSLIGIAFTDDAQTSSISMAYGEPIPGGALVITVSALEVPQ